MKKVIVIFLCLQILSGNSFAMEIMKVPFLIQHYSDHSTHEHSGEGFADFLWEHYVDSDTHAHQCEGHCDDNLPFKHCDDCSHAISVTLYTLPENNVQVHLISSYPTAEFGFENQFVSVYDCCIWQPPKIG